MSLSLAVRHVTVIMAVRHVTVIMAVRRVTVIMAVRHVTVIVTVRHVTVIMAVRHITVINRELCFADYKSGLKNYSSCRSFGQNAVTILSQESAIFFTPLFCFSFVEMFVNHSVYMPCFIRK
jgi:hypothetical protein